MKVRRLLHVAAAAMLGSPTLACGAAVGEPAAADSGAVDSDDDSDEQPPPPGWTCSERWWGEGWCDCGCGVVDVLDCPEDVATEIESCVYNACEGNQRPDPWDTVSCQYNFRSCNPDHVLAEQLPRRHPVPIPKNPPKP